MLFCIKYLDPQFVNRTGGYFHLLESSPAFDSAIDLGLTIDHEQHIVPAFDGPNIGAFEFVDFTSIKEVKPVFTVELYPNPVSDQFFIHSTIPILMHE